MKRAVVLASLIALGFAAAGTSVVAKGDRGGAPRIQFEEVDANADGQITLEELQAHRVAQFNEADTDSDGFLSAEEMMQRQEVNESARAERRMARMMERMDADGDGQISLEETQARGDGSRMIDRLDRDDDGAVSAEEFAQALGRGGPGKKGHGGGERGQPRSE